MKNLLKLAILSLGVVASASSLSQGACNATYTTINNWGAGAQIAVAVKNNGAAVSSWEVCWTFNGNETVNNLWDGTFTTTGKKVCVKNEHYNGSVAANGSAQFGFIVYNPGSQIPTAFTFNGASCGGLTSSSSSSLPGSSSSSSILSSSVSSSVQSSSVQSSSVSATVARWLLDATKSTFHFVAVKNTSTAEAFTFTQLQGTVSANGNATLTIPLASISTGVDIRNTRVQNLLFESSYLPSLHFTAQLDNTVLDAMAVGDIRVQQITGNLTLHAVSKAINFDATIVKHSSTSISFSPRRPIVINSVDFELNAGVEALRAIAGLSNIGEKVPVYFKMFLTRDNPTNIAHITLPSAPATPASLIGSVSQANGDVALNWADVSNDETGFLIRRKGANGRWTTQSNVLANTSMFTENLLSSYGSYDYKVISYRDSIPSAASTITTLVYSDGLSSSSSISSSSPANSSSSSSVVSSSSVSNSSSSSGDLVGDATRGATLWQSQSCVACHGIDGEKNANGTPAFAPLNPNRSVYRHSQDNQDRSLRVFIEMWMPQGNPQSCVGQCAADLETYILTWRRPADGIPDNPVSNFSCPNTGSSYGQRTLRLLTKKEYERSVRDLVAYNQDVISRLPDDFITGAFMNNNTLIIDKTRFTSYISTAERIATDVATRWNSVLACTPSTSCADKLVDDLAPRIFRRPLTTSERTDYIAVARGTADGRTAAQGMEIALTAMLSSPQFLYRSEVGDANGGAYKLNGYEMATYISYTFTGTTPSAALLAAAGRGELDTPAGVRQHSATLLSSASTNALLRDFVNRWLGTDQLEIKEKTGVTNFVTLANDMKQELGKNFAYAMLDSNATFASIYNPSYTHVNQRLASLYGLSFNSGSADAEGFVRTSSGERGGVLLSGAFLSRYASATDTNMVTRAVAIRRKMMCQDIPEPPSGVSLDREALAARDKEFFENPHTTQRMIFDRITSGTSCSNCHGEIINPLGGSMENYDTLGRLRSVDLKGNAINAVGTFFSPYPQLQFLNDPDRVIHSPAIQFTGGKELASTVVTDPMVSGLAQSCLATQFMSYSSGIHSIFLIDSTRDVGYPRISKAEENAYRCDITDLTNVLTTRGPRAMLEEIPALDSVMYRQEWAR
jgi:polyisoprenoid-binding protein YceI/cytochrome c553